MKSDVASFPQSSSYTCINEQKTPRDLRFEVEVLQCALEALSCVSSFEILVCQAR